jgi:hypothetical protein
MPEKLSLKPNIALGVVPTHIGFIDGLVPDAGGHFPREADGRIAIVAEMDRICSQSPIRPGCVQIPLFPGTHETDIAEMMAGLKALGLDIHLIMMVGGANPINPADEDAVVAQLVPSLKAAIEHGAVSVASTSIEEWMNGPEDINLETAIAQNVKLHVRAVKEAALLDSAITAWHIEFLRPVEFKTFTNIERTWGFIKAINKELGRDYFKLLIDSAHMGDSGLSIAENERLIAELAAAGHMGIFHASAKTTRGCLSTDDGWIGATLSAAARTGKLETVFVEAFRHDDPALQTLRDAVPGHGVDTRDGRSYTRVIIDGLVETAHRLNNLKARGFLA